MNSVQNDIGTLGAAAALLLLRNRSPPDRSPPPPEVHPRPSDLAAPAMAPFEKTTSFFLPSWGIRSRRSTCACRSKQEHDEDACSRPSPATPLDYIGTSFDPSTSGSEGFHTSPEIAPIKRLRTEDAAGGAPRSLGAKQMVEAQRKDMGILMAENRRLASEAVSGFFPIACLLASCFGIYELRETGLDAVEFFL
ncbi:hypothetical protein KSP39_PZI001808 [Platanthera zijinensis]|uniref:Uncharacterized protein n=1 Tax=Platanthera zijinensis TaxID=2320716 RepID=A0AAP0BZ62_9ASPA